MPPAFGKNSCTLHTPTEQFLSSINRPEPAVSSASAIIYLRIECLPSQYRSRMSEFLFNEMNKKANIYRKIRKNNRKYEIRSKYLIPQHLTYNGIY